MMNSPVDEEVRYLETSLALIAAEKRKHRVADQGAIRPVPHVYRRP